MLVRLEAACSCHTGNVRKNNEDNFYFDGMYLDAVHGSTEQPLCFGGRLHRGWMSAVFDGMGGERCGEHASHGAARALADLLRCRSFCGRAQLEELTGMLNRAVLEVRDTLQAGNMGTTMAALSFGWGRAWVCNVGDSSVLRLRDGVLQTLSMAHIARDWSVPGRKPPLTQCLGIDPEQLRLEPHISAAPYRRGDRYLLCSDGLTDLLTDDAIAGILGGCDAPADCAEELIREALARGGRDNITVIVCKLV